MLRHITLREFVALTASELRMQPEEFADHTFLRIAKLSLDRPAARRQTAAGQRGRELHRTLPDKAVALVGSLLEQPPVRDYPGRVAMAAVEELVRRGRGRWKWGRTGTILRFDQWARSGGFDPAWVRAGVVGSGRQLSSSAPALFLDQPLLTIGVLLGGPLVNMRIAGETRIVERIHELTQAELRELETRLNGALRFRLFHPSHDVELHDGGEVWEWDIGLLEEKVAVLVVAEIGTHSVGFGGACELSCFRRLPGEAVQLLSQQCETRSNYLASYSREIGAELIPYVDWRQVPRRLVRFLERRRLQIVDAVRRREDAIVLAEATHRAVAARWRTLSPTRQAHVRDDADIGVAHMVRAMERPSAFAALTSFTQQRIVDAVLGVDDATTADVDVDALLLAAAAEQWPAHEIRAMLQEGRERVGSVRAAAARPSYADPEAWLDLHDELFRRG